MDAPEFHQRRSVQPDAVARDRALLMAMAERSHIAGAEEEVEALSNWQVVQRVEGMVRVSSALLKAQQGLLRSAKGAASSLMALNEQLQGIAGAQLAEETELFLALDHSD
jgi:hypothetical protein